MPWRSGQHVLIVEGDQRTPAIVEGCKMMFGRLYIKLVRGYKWRKLDELHLVCGMCMGTGKVQLDQRCPQCYPSLSAYEEE